MADRWWIYSGELFWTSPDRSVKVHLLQGGSNLWRFQVRTPGAEVTFNSDVQMGGTLEVQGGKQLPLTGDQRDELRSAVRRAIPRTSFNDVEQYILDRAVTEVFERGTLSLRRLRFELHEKHGLDVQAARAHIERLAPRYIDILGESAYVTPLGLLHSAQRANVQLVVEATLRAWTNAYRKDPEVGELKFGDYFGGDLTPEIPFLRAWRIVDAFKLGTNGTDNKWNAPADIEQLVFERVTDLPQLWTYNQAHTELPRPWPFAVERQTSLGEWAKGRIVLPGNQSELDEDPAQPAATSSRAIVVVSAVVPSAAAIGPAAIPVIERTSDSDFGMQYGQWRIGQRIGVGAYGRVYACEHAITGRPAAMKILELDDDESVERFQREASSLGELSHPAVPQVFDAGVVREERTAYIVTELLHGASLDRIVHAGWRASEAEAIALFRAVATPLALAHEHGIVHRDIKPANVFIEETMDGARRLMLLDFGCAKLIGASRLTRTGVQLGSPAYRSPESWQGNVSTASDVWSLGATIYEVVRGHQPFLGDNEAQTMFNILQAPAPSLDAQVFPRLSPIVARCLQRDPGERPADASALLAMCNV